MRKLKLRAESADDVTVISSALQDAILKVGEIDYSSRDRHVTLRVSRYLHEHAPARVLSGLRIDSVMDIKSTGIDRSDPDALMVFLSMEFTPDDEPPGGFLSLKFAGGGEIMAKVEAIDLIMVDVSRPRRTGHRPVHPDI
ncbi:MAG: DUF2948 family protein [Hyphomonadaceae bacterium]|nr:DUF2948 family protein [Hyphomonadaceae bacterium]MBC6411718.1 DUF2948 family protein [Hyphomonadaceae bacterium]